MNFTQLTAGKTIALVGPGRLDRDHTADIDAHDLVYRVGAHDKTSPGTGTRVDIAFLNGRQGRLMADDADDPEFATLDDTVWLVYKNRTAGVPPGRRYSRAVRPKMLNPNAATMALMDLVQYETGLITVYGVDLYAGGPDGTYQPGYHGLTFIPERNRHVDAFHGHRPLEQLRMHRAVVKTGKVIGTDRYLNVATMTDEEYQQQVIALWQQPAEALT